MPRECLAIIESKSKVHYSCNKPVVAKVIMNTSTSGISPDVAELKDMVKALLLDKKSQNQAPATVKAVEESCVTCGGAHSYRNCPATDGNIYRDNIQEFVSQASAVNYNQGNTSYRPPMMSNQIRPPGFPPVPNNQNAQLNQKNNQNQENNFNQGPVYQPPVFQPPAYQAPAYQAPAPQTQGQNMQNQLTNLTELLTKFVNTNSASTSSSGTLPSDTIANPRSDLKAITTRSGVSYKGPQIPPPTSFLRKVVENEPEATMDTVHPTNNESTEDFQPPVVQSESLILTSEPVNSLTIEPVTSHFADALILMPKFGPSIKSLLTNKDKLSSLLDLTPTCMTLELADRSISHPVGVAEDVYVKVSSFHFPADFVIVDFDADPRVPLILGRSFLKTGRALIDMFEGELTLHVGKEAITFNLDQILRYSANYNEMTAKHIDVIDMACEEYSQEVLGFSDVIASGNPTLYYDSIVSTASPTLTPFGNSDFLLEEVDAFLALEDDHTSPKVDQSYLDYEGDILLLESFLNDDLSSPPLNQGNYLPEVRKELKIYEAKSDKSSFDEPPEVKLKDLPPHLEYAFLEDDDKLPVIIAKDLSMEEKTALITEKTTFTCPYGMFAYRHMPFGLCNAPGTFQRCMMAIFHDMIKKTMEVFMDDISVFGNSFQSCLSHLERMLKRCEDTNLCLNWEKSHFMVKKGHVGFYRRFIKDFSKISRPMTRLLEKDISFYFSKECVEASQTLKRKLIEAPILIAPDWDMPFELMCNASYFTIGAVLGQRQDKHFRPIHYAIKTMTNAESNYTTMEKEMLTVVYAFEKFRSYLIMNKSIVYTDHSALKYLFEKKDSKARLLYWVLLL
uniref:RNA-directed DNA polymerase n=1 Tax=Tanacetum cinerariifolium TaxID=118510 RepID=A0A6L2KUY6_TANCI|nr:reverse transcriptase domain-containing protein [Tanacetum cinerariifolium]